MKIERINENQIRCTLTSFDLSVRNLNLGELAYGSEKARNLFREMIQKASNEVGFEAEDIPLMVEAIPLSNESVMLVITKIEDPEELDTRFSKFSPSCWKARTDFWDFWELIRRIRKPPRRRKKNRPPLPSESTVFRISTRFPMQPVPSDPLTMGRILYIRNPIHGSITWL